MQDTNTLIEIMTELVKGFIRYPDDLKVTDSQPTSKALAISFQPHADDMGKIIGEKGGMVKALGEIAKQMGHALNLRVRINVEEPVVGRKGRQESYRVNPKYVLDTELLNLERVGKFIFNDSAKVEFHNDTPEKTTLVLCIDGEAFDFESELSDALEMVFRATGLAKGRKLDVEIDTL